ncbi:bacillithiol biosynthesis cysteine-adding enzyme BshC [Virgibacillus sp. W0181]|uniref:bacillithiol biosynthesis cysteine-adding enzyme BshC n=1 Tax=Virgibacillus sp. W0181 TaxID=3391581 RepID=UPI003F4570B3
MRMKPVQLKNENKLMKAYRNESVQMMDYFDYAPFQAFANKRILDLESRSFNRKELSEKIRVMNEEWDAPEATLDQIERLKKYNSVVVIGGQQAGLLTGPMYTVNKIISIIQYAKSEESKLGTPVIPVFWIAGEDHDFEEINHVWMQKEEKLNKHILRQYDDEKAPISDRSIDKQLFTSWFYELLEQLTETEYTKHIQDNVMTCMEQSKTYVDFFARLVFQLFREEGIVLFDSNHFLARQLESEFFVEYIEKQQHISNMVFDSNQKLNQAGYYTSLEIDKDDAHLFYHQNRERILLRRNEKGEWAGKQNEVIFTTNEIIEIAKNKPELLSNNVVTRPLMQELLFPVLAFMGGPGEISYWAALRPMFHCFNMNMPPVLPRLSFSFIDVKTEKRLKKWSIPAEKAIHYGVDNRKINWLASQQQPPIAQMVEQIKESIDKAHLPLREAANEIRTDIGALAMKNLNYLYKDIDFMERKMNRALEERYEEELNEFELINAVLYPNGGLQERTWNIISFANVHGTHFINELINETYSYKQEHYIVYL